MNNQLAIQALTNQRAKRGAAALAYVATERDIYRRFAKTGIHRLTDDDRRRLAHQAHVAGWKQIAKYRTIATVRTLRRWYRLLIAAIKPTPKQRVNQETIDLVMQLALENSYGNDAWGRRRISGECAKVGVPISPSSVRLILRQHGIPPAPDRGRDTGMPAAIASLKPASSVAIDFATVRIIDGQVMRLLYVLIAIHIGSRRAIIAGVTEHPDARFMAQCARNLTMADEGFLVQVGATHVIMDRDAIFTEQFRDMLKQAGHEPVRIAPRCPWMNGYAERFIRTTKNSVIQKVIFTSEAALRLALDQFIDHYVGERPHQGIGNVLIAPAASTPDVRLPIIRRKRVGGLINHYERAAA